VVVGLLIDIHAGLAHLEEVASYLVKFPRENSRIGNWEVSQVLILEVSRVVDQVF
jgi:hypothetical protein